MTSSTHAGSVCRRGRSSFHSPKRRRSCSGASGRSPPRRVPLDGCGGPLSRRACARGRRPAAVPRARRWTAMHCARRTRRARCRSSSGSLPARRAARARGRLRRWGSRRAVSFPRAPTQSIQHELVVERDNTIEIPAGRCQRSKHPCRAGRDVAAGAVVVAAAGVRLGAAQIGALAAAGVAEVVCARRPRVAVLTTGTELRAPGDAARPRRGLRGERRDARRRSSRPPAPT